MLKNGIFCEMVILVVFKGFLLVKNLEILIQIVLDSPIYYYSHTCEEGGAHLRISFWHSLMKLQNNYLLKKLLKWADKKCKNFNIYHAVFLKK